MATRKRTSKGGEGRKGERRGGKRGEKGKGKEGNGRGREWMPKDLVK